MRAQEQLRARLLRKQGFSVRHIARQLCCSKGSVSKWVRDIVLSDAQINDLKNNRDRGRERAINHPNAPRQVWKNIRDSIAQNAQKEIELHCTSEYLRVAGSLLYWAEGYNKKHNMVGFSNADPVMIQLMMRFFREICNVPEFKFRGCVHIHPEYNSKSVVRYWADISGIPVQQFHKTQISVSRASKNKRHTLPKGTFTIVISDVRICSQIKGWIGGIKQWAHSSAG